MVTVGGGIHGFVFLAYAATAVLVALNQRWHPGVGVLAVVSAVVPYATIPMEVWLHRTDRLRGDWRLDATEDPRDHRWYDRLMRWFLRRPWVLAVLLVVGIVALYVILLLVGPPGASDPDPERRDARRMWRPKGSAPMPSRRERRRRRERCATRRLPCSGAWSCRASVRR